TNPLDVPYLPYLSFESELTWSGLQARDSWQVSRISSLVLGIDYERVTSLSRSSSSTPCRRVASSSWDAIPTRDGSEDSRRVTARPSSVQSMPSAPVIWRTATSA